MKRTSSIVFRTLLGLGLLVGVVVWLEPTQILEVFAGMRVGPLVAALGTQVLAKLLWTYRWQAMLRANQLPHSFWSLFAIVHIGLFFNSLLPSGLGGDLVRGHYASHGRERRVGGYLTVFIERLLGMGTLAAIASLAAAAELLLDATPLPRLLLLWVVALGTVLVVGMAFAWRRSSWLLRKLPIPDRWREDLQQGIELLRRPETPRLAIVGSSFAIKLIGVVFYILCGWAVGLGLAPIYYFLVTPIAELVGMLPITPNGLGIREGALVGLFTLCGAPGAEAGAVALIALAILKGFALVGGVIYAFYRPTKPSALS